MQQADHLRRQGRCDLVDDLDRTAVTHRVVEQLRDHRTDVVLPAGHRTRREATGDQVAALLVQRVVQPDDRRVRGDVRAVAALLLVGVDEQVLALLDVDDVVVARDAPQLVGRVPVRGLVLTHPCVRRVRILDVEVAVQQIDLHRGPPGVDERCARGWHTGPALLTAVTKCPVATGCTRTGSGGERRADDRDRCTRAARRSRRRHRGDGDAGRAHRTTHTIPGGPARGVGRRRADRPRAGCRHRRTRGCPGAWAGRPARRGNRLGTRRRGSGSAPRDNDDDPAPTGPGRGDRGPGLPGRCAGGDGSGAAGGPLLGGAGHRRPARTQRTHRVGARRRRVRCAGASRPVDVTAPSVPVDAVDRIGRGVRRGGGAGGARRPTRRAGGGLHRGGGGPDQRTDVVGSCPTGPAAGRAGGGRRRDRDGSRRACRQHGRRHGGVDRRRGAAGRGSPSGDDVPRAGGGRRRRGDRRRCDVGGRRRPRRGHAPGGGHRRGAGDARAAASPGHRRGVDRGAVGHRRDRRGAVAPTADRHHGRAMQQSPPAP